MTPEEQTALGALVLNRGKALAPDRFPKPDRSVAEAWGHVLGSVNLPPGIWRDAVDLWAMERVGQRMATPREIVDAARAVRDRWERDPERSKLLQQRRIALRDARDAALERGELTAVRTMPTLSAPRDSGVASISQIVHDYPGAGRDN
ncbi:hypothetical protein [Corynebacterium amycolatum]|uniref:hypothetical protein n=1 Tax=Corynebacterium amycolatum TaxID=43765 RepID=UPI00191E21C1|nr:hypothetical protein [Corynebacterium amycolatum]QQU97768.1 hypothetical protein I6I65_10625 [Corynebacterium amycolatum]